MAWPFTRWAFQIPAESNSSALIAQTNSSGRNRSNRANTLLKIRAADRQRTMTVNAAETATATATATATETLQKGIAEFYDESSGVWEDIWGDHMHHGFYKPGSNVSLSDHRSAQIRMIEESLRYASLADSVEKLENIVDVGCGMGGSSRYLARKYGSTCEGITLSPLQAQRAQALADAQGLGDKDVKAADWSEYVAPFWPAVIKSAFTWKGVTSLLRSGWKTIKGAFAMPLMIEGYKKGLIKFSIITCKKPAS